MLLEVFFFFFVGGGKGALKNQKLLLCWMFLSAQRPSLSNGVQKVAFPRSDVKKLAALFFPNFDFSAPFTPPGGSLLKGGMVAFMYFAVFSPTNSCLVRHLDMATSKSNFSRLFTKTRTIIASPLFFTRKKTVVIFVLSHTRPTLFRANTFMVFCLSSRIFSKEFVSVSTFFALISSY